MQGAALITTTSNGNVSLVYSQCPTHSLLSGLLLGIRRMREIEREYWKDLERVFFCFWFVLRSRDIRLARCGHAARQREREGKEFERRKSDGGQRLVGRSVRCWTGGTAREGPAGRPSPAPPRGRITVASPGGYSRAFKQTAPVAVRQDHPVSGPPTPSPNRSPLCDRTDEIA